MTDKEQLELAAKAVGYIDDATSDSDAWGLHRSADNGEFYIAHANGWAPWCPREDDGDAMRLAVTLHIGVVSNGPKHAESPDCTVTEFDTAKCACYLKQAHAGDPLGATRLAIFLSAVAIGHSLP